MNDYLEDLLIESDVDLDDDEGGEDYSDIA